MLKQIRAGVNTCVPTMKADITALVMLGTDSWMITKDAKVQFIYKVTGRTFVTCTKFKIKRIFWFHFSKFFDSFLIASASNNQSISASHSSFILITHKLKPSKSCQKNVKKLSKIKQ